MSNVTMGAEDLEGDVERTLSALADRMLARVATLTATLKASEAPLVAARQILADLAFVADAFRALGTVTTHRLESADAALADARALVEGVLEDPSDAPSDALNAVPRLPLHLRML